VRDTHAPHRPILFHYIPPEISPICTHRRMTRDCGPTRPGSFKCGRRRRVSSGESAGVGGGVCAKPHRFGVGQGGRGITIGCRGGHGGGGRRGWGAGGRPITKGSAQGRGRLEGAIHGWRRRWHEGDPRGGFRAEFLVWRQGQPSGGGQGTFISRCMFSTRDR
jgi:hypothetical protein